ncbi:MAG: two pore domain potassium channel family protein [Bacteroidia bacterium]|nr:two pore domain potassium channel family protein [Bacteroidia bacterium]
MRHFLTKLLLGNITKTDKPLLKVNPIRKRIVNIQSIWNNDHQEDNGIEKIFRLFLSISQLIFPGVYIKYLFSRKNYEYQDIAMDTYIILKLLFPIYILKNNLQDQNILIYIMVYVLLETILYIPTLIFASDMLSRPKSYKRSMLLLFLNYLEIVFAFAVLYTLGDNMNKPFTHWFDAVYFSIITSNSIGYGDFYPVTPFAKVLVSIQAMFFLSFLVLFLNFFSSKVKSKGYFDHESEI